MRTSLDSINDLPDSNRPQKGARKLVIEDETWWWYYTGGATRIPIWDPNGNKTVHLADDIRTKYSLTPFDLRVYIDRNIRKIPEKQVQKFIAAREYRIKKEKEEQLEELRKRVMNRALRVVAHSNAYISERHMGDEVDIANWQENDAFIKELRILIDHGRKGTQVSCDE